MFNSAIEILIYVNEQDDFPFSIENPLASNNGKWNIIKFSGLECPSIIKVCDSEEELVKEFNKIIN